MTLLLAAACWQALYVGLCTAETRWRATSNTLKGFFHASFHNLPQVNIWAENVRFWVWQAFVNAMLESHV